VTAVFTVAWYALQEALRRRVFLVVVLLTLGFLALYWLGTREAYEEAREQGSTTRVGDLGTLVEVDVLVGATLFGLAMFATLFLGTVLAVFLTLGAVRGDVERGLLQPLVVRPVGRAQFLLARFAGASIVCTAYVLAVYGSTMAITNAAGGWWPDERVRPGLQLAAGVVILIALSLLGSVFLSSTANGILIFMVFGSGLVGGLLGQIGEGIDSQTLMDVADKVSWALPFEALYQDGLYRLTSETTGFTRFALSLGPFGGAQLAGGSLPYWAAGYLVLVGAAAVLAFRRRDL
jgi:ABC-type transport system involved in multi-copper enzyme maturation permease subunit